ncbi:MAG: tetratricopeptide repeat protein [Muribaculaceae bacterium]|nr:tetratricopeptide repeat protein [Muribaculaceae bacterium]
MKQFHLIITILVIAAAAINVSHAQVINSINEQNMKIPRPTKQDNTKQQHKQLDTPIDTTTVYFQLVDSAQHYAQLENWAKAETFILEALKSDPNNPNNSLLISNLATFQRLQGKTTQALKNYSLALDMTPNAVTLLLNRAALYAQIDSLELAQNDYKRVMKLDVLNIESRYHHGLIEIYRGNLAEAENDFFEILKIDPESSLANEGLAELNKAAGNYTRAILYYSKAIDKAPTAALFANRADCHLMVKHLNEAQADIESALQINPNDGFIYLLRAKLNKFRYQNDEMKRDLQLAEKYGVDPNYIKALVQ